MKRVYKCAAVVLTIIAVVDIQLCQLARDSREYLRAEAVNNVTVSSDVVLRRAEQLFDSIDRTLSGIGEVVSVDVGAYGRLSDLNTLRLLARRHAITPNVQRLMVVDADGALVASSQAFPAPALNRSDLAYFRARVETPGTGLYIGPQRAGGENERPFVPASRPIVNDGGRLIGVAAAAVDTQALTNILAAQALPEGYVLRLFLPGGKPLACLPDVDACHARDWSTTPLFAPTAPAAAAAQGMFRGNEWLGDDVGPGAFERSTKYPLVAAVTASEARLLQPWRHEVLRYVLAGISSNVAIALIAVFGFRQFERRRRAVLALAEANASLERRVAERTDELRRSEARARLFMNTAADAVVVFDDDERIVEFNGAAETMFGYAAAEVIGRSLHLLIPSSASDCAIPCSCHGSAFASIPASDAELVGRSKSGREFFIEVTAACAAEGYPSLCVCVIRDVTERRALRHELQRLATTDALTGVLNRGAWTRRSGELVALARRYGRPLTLMMLDADNFKRINDTYGHPAGDRVLKALADAIDVRAADVVGRLGGEEFGILLPETDADCAIVFANRLLARIRACRVTEGDHTLSFTVSMGLTEFDSARGEDLDAMLRRADRALYRAKESGRDRCVCIDAEGTRAVIDDGSAGTADADADYTAA